jgi:hypothetical protein
MTKYNELLNYSDPTKVYKNATDYFGKNVPIYISDKPTKKYMIKNPQDKWVHFGEMGYQDFTRHQDRERQRKYLKRAMGIKGNWYTDPYSANNLSIHLIWL